MNDPTRDELLSFLQAHADSIDAEACAFDVEEAAYWLASDFHGGQWSNLYAALCASPFSPGPIATGLPDWDERAEASHLYDLGAAWIRGGDDGA